ncbi:hypothetical protein [Falsibacillus pallidus]|uniref:hypothetical protein n=1 Tax=Falsibacillus pallidus TaxID=493781 RepID=UPI003D984404
MDNKLLKRNIASAGVWFVGEYTGLILEQFNRLESDKNYKNNFIETIFHQQGRDKDLGGTRTRVNAVMRIIKSNQAKEALEYVVHSSRLEIGEPKAVQKAQDALTNISLKRLS